ncbi:MAG: 5'-nucleotidase C-terminal domain-containing protein [Bacteroidota bacterium]|nr:5'-nucleotidase C-terminal domain-containing protein [Bacteroidota bacterium]
MRRLFLTFSVILILFSCNKHLVVHEVNTKNISIDSNVGPPDLLVETMVKPYRDSIEHDMSTLVAVSSAPLVKGKPESKLTNLVSDILLNSAASYCLKQNLKVQPDAAYVNYGGLRASLPQGKITVERIFELMPFENEIVLIKISGASFMLMAEKIAARGGEGVAGMKLGIRNGKVSSLIVADKTIDPKASYWLVTNDYIANGGDQMSMFDNPEERINTGLKIRDVLIQVLSDDYKKNGIIEVKEDGRIFNEQ